jgi:outer membrane protein assembly factor BamB
MNKRSPTRRQYLLAAGASGVAVLSGCSSGGDNGPQQGDGEAGDGTPTETQTPADTTPTPAGADDLTPWWTSHADPERTRSTPDPVPGSLERAGTFELSSSYTLMTHPLVTNEGLFVFRGTGASTESVARYNLASRERAFERSVRPTWTFVRDGTVVVAGSNLLGLNASTGEREWSTSAEFGYTYAMVPVPGGIAVTGDSFTGTPLRVLDIQSGEERWSKSGDLGETNRTYDVNPAAGLERAGGGRAISGRRMAPVVHTESRTIFIGIGPRVEAFDTQTGDRKWRFTPDGSQQPRPVPFAVREGRVYVRGGSGLLALDRADGGVRWKRSASDGTQNPFGGEFAYAVDDTALYFWSSAGEVRALSVEDGSDLWSTAFTGSIFNVSSAVAGDGVVYTTGNGVRVLSKSTGELKLSTDVKEPGAGAVVPAGGRIYAFTYIGESTNNPVITAYGSS